MTRRLFVSMFAGLSGSSFVTNWTIDTLICLQVGPVCSVFGSFIHECVVHCIFSFIFYINDKLISVSPKSVLIALRANTSGELLCGYCSLTTQYSGSCFRDDCANSSVIDALKATIQGCILIIIINI